MKASPCRGAVVACALALVLATAIPRVAAAQYDPAEHSPGLHAPGAGTWLTLIGLGAASALSTTFQNADEAAGLLETSPIEGLIDPADWYGDGLVLGLGAAGVLAVGHFADNERMSSFGGDLAGSLVMSAGIVWIIKPTVNATRPNGGPHSFPSGHTAAAFSVAPVIQRHLGWKAGLAAYTVASITGLARMEDRRHYLSDVLFGAAIGIASGREVVRGNGLGALFSSLNVSGDGLAVTWDF